MCFCGTEVSPFWLKVLFHSRGIDWPPHLHFGSASVLLALIFPAHSFRILGFWCELLLELCFVLKWKVQNNRFTDVFTFSAGEMCGISSRLEHWNDPIVFFRILWHWQSLQFLGFLTQDGTPSLCGTREQKREHMDVFLLDSVFYTVNVGHVETLMNDFVSCRTIFVCSPFCILHDHMNGFWVFLQGV